MMVPVKSSIVTAIGYDKTKRQLHVEFTSGHRGHYADVSPAQHAEIMASQSIGGMVHNIRRKHVWNASERKPRKPA